MKNEKNKYIILGFLVVCIVGYIYYFFYLDSQLKDISKIKSEIKKKNDTIENLKTKAATIDQEIADAKSSSQRFNVQVPDSHDRKKIIRFFYDLIKEKPVESDKISISVGEVDVNSSQNSSTQTSKQKKILNIKKYL